MGRPAAEQTRAKSPVGPAPGEGQDVHRGGGKDPGGLTRLGRHLLAHGLDGTLFQALIGRVPVTPDIRQAHHPGLV